MEAEAATPKPRKTKKAPEWKSLPDAEKAQYLLNLQTISDRTWTDERRLEGEKRDAFIRRTLAFPKTLTADSGHRSGDIPEHWRQLPRDG